VPQLYSQAIRPGASASLTLDEFPGKVFGGTIARNSNSIDPASRTLLVEVDMDNRAGQVLPGAYVRVHLKLPQSAGSVTIPANTLLFRSEGLRVGVVRNGHAELVPITIGRDYGNSVEVVSGLYPTDAVIVNPSDSLIDGAAVRTAAPAA
jgi:RND family efflux transporter MFP subunit